MILCTLLEGERSVGDLVEKIGLSQSALSQHLARLRRDGLVRTRRSSQTIYYRVAGAEAPAVLATLHSLYCCESGAEVADFAKSNRIAINEPSQQDIQRPAAA
jgi:DNA-binding transcriptional ArsR family regulator